MPAAVVRPLLLLAGRGGDGSRLAGRGLHRRRPRPARPDGYLSLDGRRDDLVITGGVNVYPAEVEAVLAEVAGVAEVAVFGVCRRAVGAAGVRCRGARPRCGRPGGWSPPQRPVRPSAWPATSGPSSTPWLDALPRTATGKVRRRPSTGARSTGPPGSVTGRAWPDGRYWAPWPLPTPAPPSPPSIRPPGSCSSPSSPTTRSRSKPAWRPRRPVPRSGPRSTFAERSPPAGHRRRTARGGAARHRPDGHHRDGQALRPGQGRGGQVRQRLPLVRRARRGDADRPRGRRSTPPSAWSPTSRSAPSWPIMPWNFPLWQVVRFLAPAVMVGNVGLLKHAPSVPRTALLLEDLFRRAGAPDGVLQTLLIGTDQVPAIIADRTGGRGDPDRQRRQPAGRWPPRPVRSARRSCSSSAGATRSSCCPRPTSTGRSTVGVQARVQNAGQSCIAAKRFIVHDDVAAEPSPSGSSPPWPPCRWGTPSTRPPRSARWSVRPRSTPSRPRSRTPGPKGRPSCAAASGWSGPGGPDQPGCLLPADRHHRHHPGHAGGHRGGLRPGGPALHRRPTPTRRWRWPTAPSSDSARACGRTTPTSSSGSSTDLQAGQVFVNGMVVSMPQLPFGGIKSSGIGRELSCPGVHEFCNVKSVWIA